MEIEQIVNMAMNSGMAVVITVYFLIRDWKYQGNLTNLLTRLEQAIDAFSMIVKGADHEK